MNGKRKTEAKRWFQQAYYDLQAARWNIRGGFYDTACFLSQQAGEKALKSLLYYQEARRTVLLTHSLVVMVREGEKGSQEAVTASEKIFSTVRAFYQARKEKEFLRRDEN